MPRRVTPAQFNNMVRRAERERQRAISDYNRKARAHNTKVKRAVADYNRDVDRHNAAVKKQKRDAEAAARQQKREIDTYNRRVDTHNRRVRQNRQRLFNELKRLDRQSSAVQYVPVQASVRTLSHAYEQVDMASESWSGTGVALADLAESETANSAAAANALLGEATDVGQEGTVITDELRVISPDLDRRWQGALFSLDSRNPDAARHFCTSAREILTGVIEQEAPDDVVLETMPDCEKLESGKPVRRAKISFLLAKSGADHDTLREFVETDVGDVVQLINVFSSATHGDAGVFDLSALRAMKQRVEGAIRFLSAIVRPT